MKGRTALDQNNITEAWWYMSKRVTIALTTIAIFLGCISPVMAGREIVPADVTVKVQYQLKMDGYNSWTTTNASLRGAVTESMMVGQLAARHPNGQILSLSVYTQK